MDQNQAIKDFLREELEQFDLYLKCSIKNDNPRIANIVDYTFRSEGKHIRPILVFLAAKACGKITPETYHGAVTVELLHMATLIHDDVVDESMIRRRQPSVNAVFDNRRQCWSVIIFYRPLYEKVSKLIISKLLKLLPN